MIFTDRTITVRKGESRIDEPIVVYRGDYELEVRFTILNSRFKFMSGTNMIESEKASYGQLAILTPYGGNIFSDIVRCNDGSVTFVLTADMLNQIEEVGLYSFQIRLMDYNKESRVSIPPIEFGIEVREPIASEDHDNSVNNAIVGYSIAKVVDPKEENVGDTFDESGNYNKTKWETGDRISEGKLNKIEDAIDKINENETNNLASLSKRIDNNFNVLESTKADKNAVFSMANMGQDIKEAMTGGSVAVVGQDAILEENVLDEQITERKTSFLERSINDDVLILEDGSISVTNENNSLSVIIKNGVITLNGFAKTQFFIKLTNGLAITRYADVRNSWGDQVAKTIQTGVQYEMRRYHISGNATCADDSITDSEICVCSVRDSNSTSLLNTTSNTIRSFSKTPSFVQLYIPPNTTFENYKIALVIRDTQYQLPNVYDRGLYELSDNIMFSSAMESVLFGLATKDEVEETTKIRDAVFDGLARNDIHINIQKINNKLPQVRNDYEYTGYGMHIKIESDGLITIDGTATQHLYIKLTNGYDVSYGPSGGNKQSLWSSQNLSNILSIGHSYYMMTKYVDGFPTDFNAANGIALSARNSSYESVLKGSGYNLIELTQEASYLQLYIPVNATYDNLKIYCGLYEDIKPSVFIQGTEYFADITLPPKEESFSSWRIDGSNKKYSEYPTSLNAVEKMIIPGTYFNAIQGGCTDGKYLYCGVVNQKQDINNTTIHKIDIDSWEIIKTVTDFSLGHCNSMTYCDYDGYIHCIGLESYNEYKRVHRITKELEYVDYYTIDISPYYSESIGIGAIDYNPNTEEFTYLIRGDKKGYAIYTKNKTFMNIIWTDTISGTYAGIYTDHNLIYQSVWVGGNDNALGIFDKNGTMLTTTHIDGMSGEIEETFAYNGKLISVVNEGYTNHRVYEITPSDFILVRGD